MPLFRCPSPSLVNHLHNIFIADDDDGHAFLVEDSLRRGGLNANFQRFADGQEVLEFLLLQTSEPVFKPEETNLPLLDIRMPKIDGIAVLERIKAEPALRALPVIMLTTTQDPLEVDRCHDLGCNVYLQKPVSYDVFTSAMAQLAKFLNLAQMPRIKRDQAIYPPETVF